MSPFSITHFEEEESEAMSNDNEEVIRRW